MITNQNLRKTLTKYRLSEHSLAIEKGRHRKTWLPVDERLCNHCTTAEPETELHFMRKNTQKAIRECYFFSDENMLPILLGEDAESCGLAAHYIAACNKMRDSV